METFPHPSTVLARLRDHAREAAAHAVVPYSERPAGAALLLADGQWVPGVRVESASFPLTIPPLLGAYVTATAAARRDIRAAALSDDLGAAEADWLAAALGVEITARAPGAVAFGTAPLPDLSAQLQPFLDAAPPADDVAGIRLAREVAERAHVPESNFPVGCVLQTEEGRLLPGCNVEDPDWPRGLCAERSALAAAAAYGIGPLQRIYLSCPQAPGATPCGACRQLLAERAAHVPLVLDQGEASPQVTTPRDLLPQFFTGDPLRL